MGECSDGWLYWHERGVAQVIRIESNKIGRGPEILTECPGHIRRVVLMKSSRHVDTSLNWSLDLADRILGDAIPHPLYGRCEHTWT